MKFLLTVLLSIVIFDLIGGSLYIGKEIERNEFNLPAAILFFTKELSQLGIIIYLMR